MRRRRLTRDQKLVVSAVAAGLLLAAGHGHRRPGARRQPQRPRDAGSSNEQLANSMAASGYGWTGSQATCLDELWTEESGFSATAVQLLVRRDRASRSSAAPRSLHALPANGSDAGRADQRWGLAYVHDRYGSPCAAWAFERSHVPNWY